MYSANGKKDQKDELLNKHAVLVKKLAYQLKAKLPPSVELDDLKWCLGNDWIWVLIILSCAKILRFKCL